MKQYYVLFPNHTQGVKLHALLRNAGIDARIAPTPRELSHSCGISLLVRESDLETIRRIIRAEHIEILGIEGLETSPDPRRDRFC